MHTRPYHHTCSILQDQPLRPLSLLTFPAIGLSPRSILCLSSQILSWMHIYGYVKRREQTPLRRFLSTSMGLRSSIARLVIY